MAKYTIIYTKSYKKSLKKLDSVTVGMVGEVIDMLARGEVLAPRYKDHQLKGHYRHFRECHIKPDLLLIYKKDDDTLILQAINVGSHSEVFKK